MRQSMLRYRTILLDWDGTIQKDTLRLWYDASERALRRRGYQLTRRQIARDITPHLAEGARKYAVADVGEFVAEVVADAAKNLRFAAFDESLWEMMEEAVDRGATVCVVSSTHAEFIAAALAEHGKTSDIFSHIISRDTCPQTKPDPTPILQALSLLGAHKDQCLMIDDASTGIVAAHRAGVDALWWYPPEHEEYYEMDDMRPHVPTYFARTSEQVWQVICSGKGTPL